MAKQLKIATIDCIQAWRQRPWSIRHSSRGDNTAIELLISSVRGWDAG